MRTLRSALGVAACSGFTLLSVGPAAAATIELPTEADAIAVAVGSQLILYGQQGIERQLPGPVRDEERVTIEVAPGGEVTRVRVVQRLTISGLGDFLFRVPGPAQDVRALRGSDGKPGLRRGSMIWQGFSDGEERLAAVADLFPAEEAARLPLRVTALEATVDGRALPPGERASGELELSFRIENVSAIPIQVVAGSAAPEGLTAAIQAVRRTLEAGERPAPGRGGIPEQLAAEDATRSVTKMIEAPFRVEGTFLFPPGSMQIAQVEGGTLHDTPRGTEVVFSALLGGGEPSALELTVKGQATNAAFPSFDMRAVPSPPSPRMLDASGGKDAGLSALMDVLWRTARLRQFDGYLGNPDPTGPSVTEYRWTTSAPAAQPRARPATPVRPFGAAGLGASAFALLLVAGAGVLLWRRS